MEELGNSCVEVFSEMCKRYLNSLFSVWEEIGIEKKQMQMQLKALQLMYDDFMKRALQDELRKRSALLENVETLGARVLTLGAELKINVKEPDENLKILELEAYLSAEIENLMTEKNKRMAILNELQREDEKLAACLGALPYVISSTTAPTIEKLEAFKKHIEKSKAEKERRLQTFNRTRGVIIQYMKELEATPSNSFERSIVVDETKFCPTEANMKALEILEHQLKVDIQRNVASAEELKNTLKNLWSLLQIPLEERDAIMSTCKGHTPSVINTLRKEICKCNKLKAENMQLFISKLREELLIWWTKCLIPEKEINRFKPYNSNDFTEEILELHEAELKRLKDYYNDFDSGGIFQKVEKREELWSQMLEFEKRGNDPKRYVNRGGGLLKEEKQRKMLMNQIPKLEAELQNAIREQENRCNRNFYIYGQSITDYIADQWETYKQEKENEKTERQMKKAKLLEEELINGTRSSGKRQHPGTPMKTRASKMSKIGSTPATPQLRAVCSANINSGITSTSRPPRMAYKSTATRKARAVPRRLHNKSRQRTSQNTCNLFSNTLFAAENNAASTLGTSTLSTYSEFQKNITRKSRTDNCRSSVDTPKSQILTTPRRYRDRIGLPFLL